MRKGIGRSEQEQVALIPTHSKPTIPLVSMGMPVYNGEPFLEEALRSLLSQTVDDFELIISDNASEDRTKEICMDFAKMDERILYHRNDSNIGLCRNENAVIEASRGKYFLLTHDDDIRGPEYLDRTLKVMESDSSITVCYTATQDIDATGRFLARQDPPLKFDSAIPHIRFREAIRMDHICEPDFGLMRLDVLRKTSLHGPYSDSDRVLLAELLLHGPFYRIPSKLFYRRVHENQSTAIAPNRQARTILYDPSRAGTLIFPFFRQLFEYFAAVNRSPINALEAMRCRRELLGWMRANRDKLFSDIRYAAFQKLRPVYRALRSQIRGS